MSDDGFTFRPIGHVRSPYTERVTAPRQAAAAAGVEGSVELLRGHDFEHALEDLEGWDRLWVVFVFHLNIDAGWRPKVLPPRSAAKRRGVFSTRSPHRPNPIGLSVVRLLGVEGLILRIADVDILDGSPVLDLKPYVPYADAFPDARSGWLAPPDPEPGFVVTWEEPALSQLAWLRDARGIALAEPIAQVLTLGPQPHPYRRIRREGDLLRLALKEWRVLFRVDGRRVVVLSIASGYRDRQLAHLESDDAALEPHRAFTEKFGR